MTEKKLVACRLNIVRAQAARRKNDGLTASQRYYRTHIATNRAKANERAKAWRAENHVKDRAAGRRSYAANAVSRLKSKQEYYQRVTKPLDKTPAGRLKDRLRKAVRRHSGGDLTAAQWIEICARHDFRCAYCRSGERIEQDHVIPVSRGGLHTATNVVPACKRCNASKSNRLLSEWKGRRL